MAAPPSVFTNAAKGGAYLGTPAGALTFAVVLPPSPPVLGSSLRRYEQWGRQYRPARKCHRELGRRALPRSFLGRSDRCSIAVERQLEATLFPRELTDMASNISPLAQGQVSDDPRFNQRYALVLRVGLNSSVYTCIGVPPNSLRKQRRSVYPQR